MLKDSEWIVDDQNIFLLDKSTGRGIAQREGNTKVHLVSKDLRKEKLVAEIMISRIRRVSVNFGLIPKYFTDIISDPYYKNEYIIPLKYFVNENSDELTKDSEDDVNLIDQKINIKCISKQPEIFVAQIKDVSSYKTYTSQIPLYDMKNVCVVTIRKIPFDIVNNLFILIYFFNLGYSH